MELNSKIVGLFSIVIILLAVVLGVVVFKSAPEPTPTDLTPVLEEIRDLREARESTAVNLGRMLEKIDAMEQTIADLEAQIEAQIHIPTPIPSDYIANGSITSQKIQDGAVGSADIADASIVSADIATGTVVSVDIGDGTVSSTDILDATITGTDIANSTIETGDIATGGVISANIRDNTVTGSDILNSTIESDDIAIGSTVNGSQVTNGTIEDGDLAPYTRIIPINIFGGVNKTRGTLIINTSYGSGSNVLFCPSINTTNTTNIAWGTGDTCWLEYRVQIPSDYASGATLNITYALGQTTPSYAPTLDLQVLTTNRNSAWNTTEGAYAANNLTGTNGGVVLTTTFSLSETFSHGEYLVFDIAPVLDPSEIRHVNLHLLDMRLEYRSSGLNQG